MFRRFFALAATPLFLLALGQAHAVPLSFDLSITQSNYQVLGTESPQDLIDEHLSGGLLCQSSMSGFVQMGSRQTCNGPRRNYSMMATVQFSLTSDENIRFRTGADWGRGGGIILRDLDAGTMQFTDLTSEDIWWRRNWNDSDVIFSDVVLAAGSWALTWIGFEGCCAGETTIGYSLDGGASYAALTRDNFRSSVAVTEASTLFLLSLGVLGTVLLRRVKGTSGRIAKLLHRRRGTLTAAN